MRRRPVRCGRWKALAVACCLASSAGLLAGCTAGRAASHPSSVSRLGSSTRPGGTTLRVLQMNLCDSGIARCYTGGRSVSMAAALIHAERPEIVTLNEVCRADVSVLERAMSATYPGARVASAFKPATDRSTNGPYRCLNGQQFGDGVLALVPSSARGYRTDGGSYPIQDLTDPEERVWLCIAVAARFAACTTHLASTSTTIALAQCRYFLRSAVPRIRRRDGNDPVILGADLNLSADNSRSCLPVGFQRADDGARQDVVAGPGVMVRSRAVIDMHGTTDHPGLLVEVTLPRRAGR